MTGRYETDYPIDYRSTGFIFVRIGLRLTDRDKFDSLVSTCSYFKFLPKNSTVSRHA